MIPSNCLGTTQREHLNTAVVGLVYAQTERREKYVDHVKQLVSMCHHDSQSQQDHSVARMRSKHRIVGKMSVSGRSWYHTTGEGAIW